ncbi:hypothetical protein IF1G_02587 [Cordyceps javanica]|uniref:Uncharacterized protein n=1 Tax=Cordyceps javanica TaxID=43265 RepID=A0A545V9W3_9HYPO|nr:hypothetical protein IF1G_02587 [Cordyceps javanica]
MVRILFMVCSRTARYHLRFATGYVKAPSGPKSPSSSTGRDDSNTERSRVSLFRGGGRAGRGLKSALKSLWFDMPLAKII